MSNEGLRACLRFCFHLIIFPESASEGFLFSTPSPAGVDRAPPDAVAGRANKKVKKTKGFSTFQTGQMSAVETGQMSAAETGQMSAVETRQMLKSQIRGRTQNRQNGPKWVQNGRQALRIGPNESLSLIHI